MLATFEYFVSLFSFDFELFSVSSSLSSSDDDSSGASPGKDVVDGLLALLGAVGGVSVGGASSRCDASSASCSRSLFVNRFLKQYFFKKVINN